MLEHVSLLSFGQLYLHTYIHIYIYIYYVYIQIYCAILCVPSIMDTLYQANLKVVSALMVPNSQKANLEARFV